MKKIICIAILVAPLIMFSQNKNVQQFVIDNNNDTMFFDNVQYYYKLKCENEHEKVVYKIKEVKETICRVFYQKAWGHYIKFSSDEIAGAGLDKTYKVNGKVTFGEGVFGSVIVKNDDAILVQVKVATGFDHRGTRAGGNSASHEMTGNPKGTRTYYLIKDKIIVECLYGRKPRKYLKMISDNFSNCSSIIEVVDSYSSKSAFKLLRKWTKMERELIEAYVLNCYYK